MYIYQLRSDYIHEDAKLYKEFPMIKFMEDLHTLLTQQTCEPAYELKELDQQLQNKTKYEQELISFMTTVLNHFKEDPFDDYMTFDQC